MGLSMRKFTVTGFVPSLVTSMATFSKDERSQWPLGGFSVMPGQGCVCPVAICRTVSSFVVKSVTFASRASTDVTSNLVLKSKRISSANVGPQGHTPVRNRDTQMRIAWNLTFIRHLS